MSDTFTEGHLERARNFLDHAGVPAGTVDTDLAQLLATIEQEARHAPGANNPPSPIDPERLIDVAALPGLLAANYGPLLARKPELEAEQAKWLAAHLVPKPDDWPEGKAWPVQYTIKSAEDNIAASDHYRLIQSYTGDAGEVEETRKKVKRAPWEACKSIDAWFAPLRSDLNTHLALIDALQKDFIRKAEAQRRQELAAIAEAENAKARTALAAAAAPTATAADELAAFQAEETADVAAAAVVAPRNEIVRGTSNLGVTTTTRKKMKVTPLPGGLMDLVKAVAEGKQPVTFLTFDLQAITAQVNNKVAPLRECPGVSIVEDFGVARSAR